MRQVGQLPGVDRVSLGSSVPWRDGLGQSFGGQFSVEGFARADGEEDPRAAPHRFAGVLHRWACR
jgi:hypothetical protein